MLNLATPLRFAVRSASPRIASSSIRPLHAGSSLKSTDSPPPTASPPRKSASDPKDGDAPKVSKRDVEETEQAMTGGGAKAELSYGQYGAAGTQEGNFTEESAEGHERKQAAKQGEQ
ncbi:hypothetical protein JCM11491_005251 [Sporobolomyces phaffii]